LPYALRYQAQLVFVGFGAGPMEGMLAPALPGSGGGTGQAKEFSVNPAVQPIVAGSGTFVQGGVTFQNALASADITALLASMSADLSTQLNAALPTTQAWVAGNP
jgi:hypothetical protein